ncbi:MAG: hypothetical protein Q8909_04550 [Bacteroidota bacterium]|nr:hypothetical protein [Bacteroidota bacterium]
MKTSLKIIIAFAFFLSGSMLFLFADAIRHSTKEISNISYKEYPLQKNFKVIVAEKGSDVNIVRSDSTSIKIEYIKGKAVPAKMYEVINDTLHVYGGLRTFVKCDNITTVIGKHQWWFGVYKFAPQLIKLRMTGGTATYSNEEIEEKPFDIDLSVCEDANIEVKNVNLRNLNVSIDRAHVNLDCHIQNLAGKVINHSDLKGIQSAQNISVQRDTTSAYSSVSY